MKDKDLGEIYETMNLVQWEYGARVYSKSVYGNKAINIELEMTFTKADGSNYNDNNVEGIRDLIEHLAWVINNYGKKK